MEIKNKKKIIIIAAAVLFALGLTLGLVFGLKNRPLKVAVYDLPENLSSVVEEYVHKWNPKTKVSVIDKENGFSVAESKKYDAVFTWNGAFAQGIAKSKSAREFPASVYSQMPSALRRSAKVDDKNLTLPILFEHVPLYFCTAAGTYDSSAGPETLAELEENLATEKGNFSFTMLLGGSSNPDFYDLISMFAESILGGEGYKNLAEKILEKKDFHEVLNETVSVAGDGAGLSLKTVLDRICQLQDKNLIMNQWYTVGENDLMTLMQYQDVYVGSMDLSYYRKLPRRIAYGYGVYRFPVEDAEMDHGLVVNEIVMLATSKKKQSNGLGSYFVSMDIQEQLSNVTTFSPVQSQAGSYDIIADDARFYSAASKWGPLPSLDRLAFTSEEDLVSFAEDVRKYLKVRE